jgi:hypothetical protein
MRRKCDAHITSLKVWYSEVENHSRWSEALQLVCDEAVGERVTTPPLINSAAAGSVHKSGTARTFSPNVQYFSVLQNKAAYSNVLPYCSIYFVVVVFGFHRHHGSHFFPWSLFSLIQIADTICFAKIRLTLICCERKILFVRWKVLLK